MRNFILAVFLVLGLCSCVETISMDPEEELPVVVYCILHPDHHQQELTLFYAKGKSESDYIPVTDAKAYLLRGRDTIGVFEHTEGPTWVASPELKQRVTYDLLVKIPGREDITATTKTPDPFGVHSDVSYFCIMEPGTEHLESVKTPHHLWIVARKNSHRGDESNEGNYPYILTDNPYADNFNLSGLKFSDVSFEYAKEYDYFWELTKKRAQQYPDIPIHKGFVRIDLPAYYKDPKTEQEKRDMEYLLEYEGFLMLCLPIAQGTTIVSHWDSYFDFYSLSTEYDTFLRNIYVKEGELEHDMTSVYSMSNVYTNIHGGLGVFGSVYRTNYNII